MLALEDSEISSPLFPDSDVASFPVKDPLPFGDYILEKEIGHGGMGVVYRARQLSLARVVALKLLLLGKYSSAESIECFQREARSAAGLNHPNIVPIYEVGEHDGQHFFSMEFVDGKDLEEILESGPLPPCRAAEIVLAIADAVQFAHEHGMLHRDLKPSNVLVDRTGKPRLTDFGLAKRIGEQSELTRTGRVMGTPNYLAPEAVLGAVTEIGVASDVYGIGAIFYELLTARPPFLGSSVLETIRSICHDEPAAPRVINSSVPRDFETVCLKCLAKDPKARYSSAAALREDCKRLLTGHPPLARRPGPIVKLQKWAQRNIGYVLLVSTILIVSSLAYAIVRDFRAERDLARQLATSSAAWGNAELASRNGQWREALRYWREAEAAGYGDKIYLGLRRAEAWTVLSQPDRAGGELVKLSKRADLGERRGTVLLYLGEHELFDKGTYGQGVNHIQQAVQAGLMGADKSFAAALLAESTPRALELFRETLKLNPFHHGAHRHSLGLEHLLGRHEELAEHIRVFKTLFPDDPSGTFVEASELALAGNLANAQARLESVSGAAPPELLNRLRSGLRLLTLAAKYYDVDVYLGERPFDRAELDQLLANVGSLLPSQGLPTTPLSLSSFRVPDLPCIQSGIHEAFEAVQTLMVPLWGDMDSTVRKIKSSWGHHPEALLPMFAATSLDSRHPRGEPKSLSLLLIQADLFQLAADSSSVLPSLGRLALYRAARVHFELAERHQTNSVQACLANIRNASRALEISPSEGRTYFEMAFALNDYDLARTFLKRWEEKKPRNTDALQARIRLEISTGTFGEALKSIDQLLARSPEDKWAAEQKQIALKKLNELIISTRSATNPNP